MADKIVTNQAEINRAIAAQQAAERKLAAALQEKQAFAEKSTPTIVKSISDLSSGIRGFTETLKSGKGVGASAKSVRETMAAGDVTRTALETELAPLESAITSAQDVLSSIRIPAPIYKTEEEGPVLAKDIFRKTLALFFGDEEAGKAWVDELYGVVSGYYKSGATIDEALNFSLRDVRNNPNLTKFTNRFRAIFALEDKLRAGQAVYVPSISEYVQTETKVGEVFRAADLKEFANQDFIADVLSLNKSVSEITGLVNNAFNLIDNAPEIWKKELSSKFPTATRSELAKTILLGSESAKAIEKTAQVIGVQAAAKAQGLSVTEQRAQDIFGQGYGFSQSLQRFGEVAQILPRGQQLAEFSRQAPLTQLDVEQARIEGLASQQRKLQQLAEEEAARYQGRSGTTRYSITPRSSLGTI